MSPFSCSWCCVYTHTATYLTNHRDGKRESKRGRERGQRETHTERQQASQWERRGRKKNRKKQREKGIDKALLPDSRQLSFPYPAKCNSCNAATGSVLPDQQSEKGIFSISLLLANKQFKCSWLHLLYLCSIMRSVLFQFWHSTYNYHKYIFAY